MALFSQLNQVAPAKSVRRICVTSLIAISALCGAAGIATDVQAGFQLVAPVEKAPTPVVPPVNGADGGAMPAPMQLPATPPASDAGTPAPSASVPPVTGAEPTPASVDAAPAAVPAASEKVDGFGRDIPLTVALKQILPPSYGFALEGVDGSKLVSWEGGRAWYHVLDDMLTKAKLYGREEGQIIKISLAKMPGKTPDKISDKVSSAAGKEPPVIVPPMPVLENPPAVQKIEPTPPVAAKGAAPVAKEPATQAEAASIQAGAEPALPPIPQGELVAPNATMMPQLQPTAAEIWHAEPGDHLHAVIKKWCARAHVELVWSTEYDYPIQASVNFSGSFEDAVRSLLTGFVEAKPQPFGRLHDNPAVGQRTLVIEARGNTNSD